MISIAVAALFAASCQKETPAELKVSQTEMYFAKEGGTQNISFTTNVAWTASSSAEWCRLSATSGDSSAKSVSVTASENTGYDDRTATVTISAGELKQTVTVTQGMTKGIFITTPEYDLSNESHNLTVEVKSNVGLEVISDSGWITHTETKALTTSNICLAVDANRGYDGRTGTVTVKEKGGKLAGVVTIRQAENLGLELSGEAAEIGRAAQDVEVVVNTNVEFTVVVPEDARGMIVNVKYEGGSEGTKALVPKKCVISVSENTTGAERTASITFKQTEGTLSGTFKITQSTQEGTFGGEGTEDSPYLLYTAEDLVKVSELCREVTSDDATPTYFKLMANINLAGIDWNPINTLDPYAKKVDFNGNGKTISNLHSSFARYPSLFGVLFGEVYDLKIADAVIEGELASGIVGGYAGTNAKFAHSAKATNVHVTGTVSVTTTSLDGVGGLFGRICNTRISRCSANVTVNSAGGQVGGIVGNMDSGDCSITDCFSQGLINCPTNSQRNAGIVGCIKPRGGVVENCISLCDVVTNMCAGGIVGHANENSSSAKTPGDVIRGCIAWNKSLTALKTKTNNYGSGAVVGFSSPENTLSDCWRRRDLVLSINPDQTDRSTYPLNFVEVCDQPDASASSPLTVGVNCDYSTSYVSPYHGKVAAEGETASDIARKIGWDENVWDLSGDIPVLYNSDVVPEEGGGEEGGGEEYVIPGDDIPNHPAKTPDLTDDKWTKTEVEDGLIYWNFTGTDPISGVKQIVHVADVDLNKGFGLRMAYDANQSITSNIYKKYNAVVAMNGGFGASSIFIKVNGTAYRKIQSDKDSDTGILNWRNDGAICTNKEGRAFIPNSIFSQDGDGQSEYGAQLEKQREFYKNTLASIPNIISGAPLLIDGYNPLGLTFVPAGISISQAENNYAYEHPYRHQGVRHPRTAVALTGDNHILMVVADGRRKNYCYGFTAKELTQFLIDHFDPKYALNLDGGGSSTLCVEKCGDSDTHVVNYPCEGITNKDLTVIQERTVQSFLYIVKE